MRRYGIFAGNPKGIPEDTTKCVEEVQTQYDVIGHQCDRKRGYGPNGLYCKQHGKFHRRGSNPMYYCPNCSKWIGERGYCSDKCRIEWENKMWGKDGLHVDGD